MIDPQLSAAAEELAPLADVLHALAHHSTLHYSRGAGDHAHNTVVDLLFTITLGRVLAAHGLPPEAAARQLELALSYYHHFREPTP